MIILKWLKIIFKKSWRILCFAMTVLGFLVAIGLCAMSYFSGPCKRNIVRTMIPLANSSSDILVIDNACSVDTKIVAEDRNTHKRSELAFFAVMEGSINIEVVDNQIVITVPTFEGMSRYPDKVDSYSVVFKSDANKVK